MSVVVFRINASSTASSSGPCIAAVSSYIRVTRDPEPPTICVGGATANYFLTSSLTSLPASAYHCGALSVDPHSTSYANIFVEKSAGRLPLPREDSTRRKALCGAEHQQKREEHV